MKRANDIQQKLAYALTCYNAFCEEVRAALIAETQPIYLGDKLAGILAACRECFDYAAKDMAEALATKPPAQVYFPFSTETLCRKPWNAKEHENHPFVRTLRRIARRIENNSLVPGTRIGHKILAEINSIVNDKKHNVITVARARENSRTLVTFPNGTKIFVSPMTNASIQGAVRENDLDAPEVFLTDPSMQSRTVPDFRLAFNNEEVTAFATESIAATWRTLAAVYKKCFGIEEAFFNPHETIKSAEQRAVEAAKRSLSPIVYRPLGARLLYKGEKNIEVRMNSDGQPESNDPTLRWVAFALCDIFTAFVWPTSGSAETDKGLLGSYEAMASSEKERHWYELVCDLNVATVLAPPSGALLRFDQIVFGMGIFVRSSLSPRLRLHMPPSEVDSLIRAIFGEQRTFAAIYKDPIPMPARRHGRWLRPDSWTARAR